MKLAISNLAWNSRDDALVAGSMREAGAEGVELAPTKVWGDPLGAEISEIVSYRRRWEAWGLPVIALQSLTYGQSNVSLFGSQQERTNLADRLTGMVRLAAHFGAKRLVFGAPRHRVRGRVDLAAALDIAVPFFASIGASAAEEGVCLCIEPNPSEYGCDFITTATQGIDLVQRVGSPGFGLHLDAAAMTLAGDKFEVALPKAKPFLRHFHVSEPLLAQVGSAESPVDHAAAAAALQSIGYAGWVSIEMLLSSSDSSSIAVERALEFVTRRYGMQENEGG